ncbi:MAG: asparagine--tRNA ligase [Candidatus Magasanikbacteria bacterium CG_4_10_14_0_2_um_filter_41_10]|uniref:Asparagine--tRNA ligase n=1 Tax=Candidatus Magasanikbacteria bacterium CG_4_10_14_0_2_um_filter_41_10 TaxID=1974638 RepID=A0A2M7V2J0_9BACT|nr:MAG: asparagine--tRNA ligase [Candidatus Magasanikbacteria bacterium CG_4_10_14_0_2_um_filter_41_10]
MAFFEIRDGSGFTQAVVAQDSVADDVWQTAVGASQETSVRLTGTVSAHPKKEGVYELQVSTLTVVGTSEEYPIGNKEHGPDFLMNHRHLWLRSKKQWAILRIRDTVQRAIMNYMHEQTFVRTDSPIFTPNACEGTTDLFPVPYFDLGEAYLSQSGQLYIEAAIASVGRCYDFGPVFRAEKSVTKRHLTEFWMMDAEAAFVEHDENMNIQQGLVKYIVSACLKECTEEFVILERDTAPLQKLLELSFERLEYDDAIVRLNELGSDIKHGEDLGNDDEGLLTQNSDVPVFIHKWPKNIKPFYMKIDPKNPARVFNNDLIGIEGSGEIIGGSQREDDYDLLLERIKADGLSPEEYEWYLDLRKYGSVPHSGFGIGLERMVRWMSGTEHIRECIPFPRLVNRIKP